MAPTGNSSSNVLVTRTCIVGALFCELMTTTSPLTTLTTPLIICLANQEQNRDVDFRGVAGPHVLCTLCATTSRSHSTAVHKGKTDLTASNIVSQWT